MKEAAWAPTAQRSPARLPPLSPRVCRASWAGAYEWIRGWGPRSPPGPGGAWWVWAHRFRMASLVRGVGAVPCRPPSPVGEAPPRLLPPSLVGGVGGGTGGEGIGVTLLRGHGCGHGGARSAGPLALPLLSPLVPAEGRLWSPALEQPPSRKHCCHSCWLGATLCLRVASRGGSAFLDLRPWGSAADSQDQVGWGGKVRVPVSQGSD